MVNSSFGTKGETYECFGGYNYLKKSVVTFGTKGETYGFLEDILIFKKIYGNIWNKGMPFEMVY
jgi:hypothetical protein